jgi:hypothetical protein
VVPVDGYAGTLQEKLAFPLGQTVAEPVAPGPKTEAQKKSPNLVTFAGNQLVVPSQLHEMKLLCDAVVPMAVRSNTGAPLESGKAQGGPNGLGAAFTLGVLEPVKLPARARKARRLPAATTIRILFMSVLSTSPPLGSSIGISYQILVGTRLVTRNFHPQNSEHALLWAPDASINNSC